MIYEKRVVCFIDILGFSSLISETLNSDSTYNEERIEHIFKALMSIRNDLSDYGNLDAQVTQFSDSIVISFPIEKEGAVCMTLLDIQHLLISLIQKKILCRGGISIGPMIHDDKILFGPALIDAYTLESKVANYPRVILSEEVILAGLKARSPTNTLESEAIFISNLVKKDSDGMYYIDYITDTVASEFNEPEDYKEYLNILQSVIETGLENKKVDIKAKYNWLNERILEL